MAAPIIVGVIIVVGRFILAQVGKTAVKKTVQRIVIAGTVYEVADIAMDAVTARNEYKKVLREAKDYFSKAAKGIKEEIEENIKKHGEVGMLLSFTNADSQGQMTHKGEGRGSAEPTIKAAIKQKIPFRKIIGLVCEKADQIPVMILRKKSANSKGSQNLDPKDFISKKKLVAATMGIAFEAVTDIDVEKFSLVKLKQLMASLLFHLLDEVLDWASPLKPEVSFLTKGNAIAGHPVETRSSSKTMLRRSNSPFNPFYPAPYRARNGQTHTIADLVIPEYRHKPCHPDNVFAIIEIKFPNDTIEVRQFRQYHDVLNLCALEKHKLSSAVAHTKQVKNAGRLALFRYPEDMPATKDDGSSKKPQPKGKR